MSLLWKILIMLLCPYALANDSKAPQITFKSSAKNITADHSQFKQLQQDFDYAPDVTSACLECHTEAGKQVMKTFHWNWGIVVKGKKIGKGLNAPNNYCITGSANETMCTKCHIGYGYRDKNFDFEDEANIDCLVCHDTTGTYKKLPSGGFPEGSVNLKLVAQNVGKPQRHNCLYCHAYGGGGDGVKHGDTDSSLYSPDKKLDVHMDSKGLNFSCQDCHTADGHKISGRYHDHKPYLDFKKNMGRKEREGDNVSCESCHGEDPHKDERLNGHTKKVACASCHIPYAARGGVPTKMTWDWASAGLNTEGKLISQFGGTPKETHGHPYDGRTGEEVKSIDVHSYTAKKGTFTYAVNIIPEYAWYEGLIQQITFQDQIDPSAVTATTKPSGSYDNPMAKIWPFKIHRATMPYDLEHKTLLPPLLFGNKGSSAFWADYDWAKSLEAGTKYAEVPFSGKFGFAKTESYWVLKHMVAPKEESVSCHECHSREGRMKGVPGFYLVGRDQSSVLDAFGFILIIGSTFGVSLHGFGRYFKKRRKNKPE